MLHTAGMRLFGRPAPPAVAASACVQATVSSGGLSALASAVGAGRERAMSIPAVARSRDLLVSLVSSCPIRQFGTQWNGEHLEEIPLAPEPWMIRPDPRTTRSHWLAWICDDLIFYGRAFALVTSRTATGFPASFQWLPSEYVSVQASMFAGNAPVTQIEAIRFQGTDLAIRDVVCFWATTEAAIRNGARAIVTNERLDIAAQRFASSPIAFGWLRQVGGEPLSATELTELAEGWALARDTNTIAALNEYVIWEESSMDPSRLQLVEARRHQAVECARFMSVPAYLINADAGTGMTYQNAQQASADLVQFGALPYLEVIEQTLSSDQVTPRGRMVRLDRTYWLDANPLSTGSDGGDPIAEPLRNGVEIV